MEISNVIPHGIFGENSELIHGGFLERVSFRIPEGIPVDVEEMHGKICIAIHARCS